MMTYVVNLQNQRFVEYAQEKIRLLGDAIQLWHSANHMDRTGNLLNSLCWGVSYQGKLVDGGFYREAVTKSGGVNGDSTSYMHEWFGSQISSLEPVDGRALAERYLEEYGNNGRGNGWKVFFAILAPYWGYWEKGFNMRGRDFTTGQTTSRGFRQFAVMTEFYDKIKHELKPMRVRPPRISVRKYDYSKLEEKSYK